VNDLAPANPAASAVPPASAARPGTLRMIALGALGMGGPVVAGFVSGHAQAGFTIGLGALLLTASPGPGEGAPGAPAPGALPMLPPALAAVLGATAIAGHAWSDGAFVAVAGLAALASGYSRVLAGAAIRFIVYLVLSAGFLDGAPGHHGAAALVFGSGAIWNIGLRVMLAIRPPAGQQGRITSPVPTAAQRRAHFRRGLATLPGLQFPLRLVLGLSAATAFGLAWPGHHFHWIVLTVALLTQRPVETLPRKTIERLAGTFGGVLVAAVTLVVTSTVALAAFACLLAGLLPLARARSYLLYSMIATPLILLVLDMRRPVELALLTDRLVATFIGGGLVVVLNVLLGWFLRTSFSAEPTGRAVAATAPQRLGAGPVDDRGDAAAACQVRSSGGHPVASRIPSGGRSSSPLRPHQPEARACDGECPT
jgi:hypothetical protein